MVAKTAGPVFAAAVARNNQAVPHPLSSGSGGTPDDESEVLNLRSWSSSSSHPNEEEPMINHDSSEGPGSSLLSHSDDHRDGHLSLSGGVAAQLVAKGVSKVSRRGSSSSYGSTEGRPGRPGHGRVVEAPGGTADHAAPPDPEWAGAQEQHICS